MDLTLLSREPIPAEVSARLRWERMDRGGCVVVRAFPKLGLLPDGVAKEAAWAQVPNPPGVLTQWRKKHTTHYWCWIQDVAHPRDDRVNRALAGGPRAA